MSEHDQVADLLAELAEARTEYAALAAAALDVVCSVSAAELGKERGFSSLVPKARLRELAAALEEASPGSVAAARRALAEYFVKRARFLAADPGIDVPIRGEAT